MIALAFRNAAVLSDGLRSVPTCIYYCQTPRQVQCGGKEFEMHADVVSCGSEYFRAMLEHAMV